jgi:hypothetical protein
VTDSSVRALADIPVAWTAADGGTLTALTPRTDSLGEARALWRLGPRAGRQRARIQAGNPRSLPPVTISATALPAPAVALAVADGSGQVGIVGKALKSAIAIRALDRYGNPVPGASLVRASGSGAAVDGAAVTDSSGMARFRWTLGGEAAAQRLMIRLRDDTASAVVTARAAAGEPSTLTLVGPGRWGGLTQLPVTLSLTDSYGNPVAGRVVSLRTGSGSVKPARVTTDGEGRAQVRWAAAKVRSPLVASVSGTRVSATLSRPRP